MAKYLIKNVNEFRTVELGRLRFSPGQQMWIEDELFGHRKVQSLIKQGVFSTLQAKGLPEPEVVESVPAPEPSAEAPDPEEVEVSEPAVEEQPEVEEKEEAEAPPALSKSELSKMKVADLRDLADSRDVFWKGLRKADLIDALLEEGE